MANVGTVSAQITQTPEVDNIPQFTVSCIKQGTSLNKTYDLDYESLNADEKQKVDQFIELIINKAP